MPKFACFSPALPLRGSLSYPPFSSSSTAIGLPRSSIPLCHLVTFFFFYPQAKTPMDFQSFWPYWLELPKILPPFSSLITSLPSSLAHCFAAFLPFLEHTLLFLKHTMCLWTPGLFFWLVLLPGPSISRYAHGSPLTLSDSILNVTLPW